MEHACARWTHRVLADRRPRDPMAGVNIISYA